MLICPYQQSWKEDFNRIKNILETALTGLNISIEHIGSTAVPNLAAKAIIDIDVVFKEAIDFEEMKERLEQIDYYHNGDQGIKDREVFKRKKGREQHPILDSIRHHLYVCPSHSEELRRHLAFRDILIQNEAVRKKYQVLKYEIAAEADQDRKRYAQLKEGWAKDFVLSIIEEAK